MLFTCVFLQAVLLWDIHCSPVKNGFAPTYKSGFTGGGSLKAPSFYPPEEQVDSGPEFIPGELSKLESTLEDGGYESETQERGFPPPPPGRPHPPPPPSGPEFIPGELLRIENTMEGGGYKSETQERGFPPSPPYEAAVEKDVVFTSPPDSEAITPRSSFGYFYPYDWMFVNGQYPPGTYTHSSSSAERGRDYWQENHYLGYDYPASPVEEEEQWIQTFPSPSDQSSQLPGPEETSGPGEQFLIYPSISSQGPLPGLKY